MEGFRLVQLGVYYSNHQTFVTRIGSFLLFALLASWETVRRPADLVFASSTPLTVTIPALLGRWVRGRPYVLEIRDLWPDLPVAMGLVRNPVLKWILYGWERLSYRRALRLVALAPGIQHAIAEKAGVPAAHITMVPNGSDIEGLRPLARRPRRVLPVADERMVLAYAGTFGIANGLDAVLDAARVLKRRGADGACFVLMGDGREKAHLAERIRSEGLENVLMIGLVGKARYNEALSEIDVGLQILLNLPAFYYGTSPNKFFDYLAAGRPVLVNYPGWMSDLVTESGCGVAVPPDDPEAFADAVERLLADRGQLATRGRAARALAEERFAQSRLLPGLVTFVEQATSR
jgi:glycosyltransferase involved in cell wall biosynthesis